MQGEMAPQQIRWGSIVKRAFFLPFFLSFRFYMGMGSILVGPSSVVFCIKKRDELTWGRGSGRALPDGWASEMD